MQKNSPETQQKNPPRFCHQAYWSKWLERKNASRIPAPPKYGGSRALFFAVLVVSFTWLAQFAVAQNPGVLATVTQVRALLAARSLYAPAPSLLDAGLVKGIKKVDASATNLGTWPKIQQYFGALQQTKPSLAAQAGEAAIESMTASVGDPYTALLTRSDMQKDKLAMESGSLTGIGVELAWKGALTVVAALPNSPAKAAGLKSGDKILAIDGQNLQGMTFYRAGDLLTGQAGSIAVLQVKRAGKLLTFRVKRSHLNLPGVASSCLGNSLGKVSIGYFSPRTGAETATALQQLMRQGCRAVMVDLRGNPGGDFSQGTAVASLFCHGDLIIKETRGQKTRLKNSHPAFFKGPVAVLMDGGTASSAEIVAQSLQGLPQVKLVGEKTFGKGLIQTLFPLPGGYGLRVTTARYLSRQGLCVNGRGLTPDIVCSSAAQEAQAAAERWLRKQLGN